jgi:metal-responsive CopG/Arc/MetJ family transcriptional regulator
MKIKISVTLSQEVVDVIDKHSCQFKNRSDFVETAIRAFIANIVRDEQNARDLAIINREADRLNKEAADVLAYQVMGHD